MNSDITAGSTTRDVDWFSHPRPGHLVQFYNTERELVAPLAQFIGAGIGNGDNCIVIATQKHIESLDSRLLLSGIDASHARMTGHYITLDAAETLERFMVNGLPDPVRYLDSVGAVVAQAASSGRPIRAYGEMVALLWEAGNKDAMLCLEELWNGLGKTYDFSLFCAYPALHFIMDAAVRQEIEACHNVNLAGAIAA